MSIVLFLPTKHQVLRESPTVSFEVPHIHTLNTIPCSLRSHAVTGVEFFNDERKSQTHCHMMLCKLWYTYY